MILKKSSIRNTTIALAAALAIYSGTAAADSEPRLTVTFISDQAQGEFIGRQEYERAVDELKDKEMTGIRGFFVANNLCISYLKTGEASQAEKSCDLAVDRIQTVLANNRNIRPKGYVAREYEKFLAIALSNRGVTYVVNDKPAAARADFAKAIEIRSQLQQAKTNLARLEVLVAASA